MLQPSRSSEMPEPTKLVAQAAFRNGSIVMTIRDELGVVFEDNAFADLYPSLGQPVESPARLALVTVMQFVQNLTDRQAADAVRGRIDWRHALGLELVDPGFLYSVLSGFRQRLVMVTPSGSCSKRTWNAVQPRACWATRNGNEPTQHTFRQPFADSRCWNWSVKPCAAC